MSAHRWWSGRRLPFLLVVPLLAALLGTAVSPRPAAASEPSETVIAAALEYLGRPYKWGAEGPHRLDCSGLIFRAFSDAGHLKAVGNARMRAVGYLHWFERRGLVTQDESQAKRGDLIVYSDGKHIGIYLGRGEVVSALTTSGITVHRIHGISYVYSHVLKVDWSMDDGKPYVPANERDDEEGLDGLDTEPEGDELTSPEEEEKAITGLATGSLHLRTAADPEADILGVVSRGSRFTVTGAGHSPSGALWLNVATSSGEAGWIWSQFTDLPEGTDLDDLVAPQPEPVGIASGSLNLRTAADPAADIVGWVSQGSSFKVLGGAHSPSGWLWLNVETETGETGWIWSYWTDYPVESEDVTQVGGGTDPTSDGELGEEVQSTLALATTELDLRLEPDHTAPVVASLTEGSVFTFIGHSDSPSGWLWLNVETVTGETGWIWSYWTEHGGSLAAGDEPT